MKNLYISLFIFIFSFLLLIILFADVTANYFPSGDEISLIVNSCESYDAHISKWFSHGFSGYFTPYPEWNDPMKTIIRPVINFVFFINNIFFKNNYGLYLLFTYFLHSLSCAFVFIICAEYLKLRHIFCFSAAFLMFINPAVTNADFFFHPGFAFDALDAVFFFLCYLILENKRKYFYFICIPVILALFTKEISILLCFLIPITLYIRFKGKSFIFISSVTIIFIIYSLIRNISGFETLSDSSLDHFKNIKDFSSSIIKAILVYPAGFYSINDVSQFYKEFYFSASTIVITVPVFLLPEILSLSIGIILIFKRKILETHYGLQNFRILFMWAFFILLYLILMGLDLRFAYSFYLFFIPLLFSLFKLEKKFKAAAALFLICFLIFNLVKFTAVLTVFKEKNLTRYDLSRRLTEEFKRIDNDYPVILVNDVSALFGSNSLSRFCYKKNEVVKINSLNYQASEDRMKPFTEIKFNRDSVLTIIIKNLSGGFLFEGVNKNFNHLPAVEFNRNDSVSYFFPEERLQRTSSKGKNIYDFGRILLVKINTQTHLNVLHYDIKENKFNLAQY